jgi:replicative DNA helicase
MLKISTAELLKTAYCVIAGAWLKKEDNNNNKENTLQVMESIRESGDIEQDAHNVVILNKDSAEVAPPPSPHTQTKEGDETTKKMEIKVVE